MIRAGSARTVNAFSRTVQSGYPERVDPARFIQEIYPGKITVISS